MEYVWKAICQMPYTLKYLWNSDVLDTVYTGVYVGVCVCVYVGGCVRVGKSDALEAVYITMCLWNTDIIDCLCWSMCVTYTLDAVCIGVWKLRCIIHYL